ncbi:hypothetical protein EDM53_03355 [Rickettsiales endosymbiont of Peranema trichophorum]|uniref:hypothetical protein n=1 Tax=Rickettsiales endosymbiont of Peranema trichophorum TaxID=2486577 RepID=UPI001023AD64|nr:hypothetical protein [Rickettsiales endosymbiont of Peranema trichophorum]RZI47169.1 hypothetical protein EDM53_03355 [Rickettsiales endosymbiont of Peranema trichophorum]
MIGRNLLLLSRRLRPSSLEPFFFRFQVIRSFFQHATYPILVIATLHLSACSQNGADQFVDIKGFDAKQKGIVIIQTGAKKSTNDPRYQPYVEWKSVRTSKYIGIGKKYLSISHIIGDMSEDDVKVIFIESGEYTLTHVSLRSFSSSFFIKSKLLNDVLKFKAEAGKVTYIGRIVVRDKKHAFIPDAIDVEDDYDAAKKYFLEKYPQIKQPVEKHLMYFTPEAQAFKKLLQKQRTRN